MLRSPNPNLLVGALLLEIPRRPRGQQVPETTLWCFNFSFGERGSKTDKEREKEVKLKSDMYRYITQKDKHRGVQDSLPKT